MPYYAVKKGHKIGIFNNWSECKNQINGYKNPVYKKFISYSEAEHFIQPEKRIISQNDVKKTDLIVFTDGSCFNNGKKNASAAIGIYFYNDISRNISEKIEEKQTNNYAELFAIIKAIKIGLPLLDKNQYLIIVTDSNYSIDCLTVWGDSWSKQNWKKKDGKNIENLSLIKKGYKLINKYPIKLCHVNSHTGKQDFFSKGNDMADKLAVSANYKSSRKIHESQYSKNNQTNLYNSKSKHSENNYSHSQSQSLPQFSKNSHSQLSKNNHSQLSKNKHLNIPIYLSNDMRKYITIHKSTQSNLRQNPQITISKKSVHITQSTEQPKKQIKNKIDNNFIYQPYKSKKIYKNTRLTDIFRNK